MDAPQVAAEAYPPRLLDHYAGIARGRPVALTATALRTRSLPMRHVLARLAGGADLDTLLAAARHGGGLDLPRDAATAQTLADLGRVIALQGVAPTDASDGLALLDLALARSGPQVIPPAHQGLHAQLAFHLGRYDRAEQLRRGYPHMPEKVAQALRVDLANPSVRTGATGEDAWLALLRQFLPQSATMTLDNTLSNRPALDRLVATTNERVDAAELVTVIVTCYKPDQSLIAAVRSLLKQTWQAIEVIIVDDASPDEHDSVLQQCAELDERIRLVRRHTNGGTYRARNTGLQVASGMFVTFQDSDDWSHPARLDAQVRPLLEHPELVGTLIDTLNVSDQLVLTRPGRELLVPIPTQLMFRRDRVTREVGFFDRVRKAGDTEYLRRIEAVFGLEAVRKLNGAAYALHRVRSGSLSDSDFAAGWVHPARAAYWAAYGAWHNRIRTGRSRGHLPRRPATRPFAAPAYISGERPAGDPRVYDVVYAGDWRGETDTARAAVDEIAILAEDGLRVGVVQLESLQRMAPHRLPVNGGLQELINRPTVDQLVLTDEAVAGLVVVRTPSVLQFPPGAESTVRAARTLIVADEPPTGPDGTALRYTTATCDAAARQLFSADPGWCPVDPAWRADLAAANVMPYDFPAVVAPGRWRVSRDRFRSSRPVLGVLARDDPAEWPADRALLQQVYPVSPEVDVRLWGSAEVPRTMLDTWQVPPNWLAYKPGDLSLRSFLNQLDFFAYFPATVRRTSLHSVLAALSAGCVTLLPDSFAPVLGEAAVYCQPHEVRGVVDRLRADSEAFLQQSALGASRAAELASHDALVNLVRSVGTADGKAFEPARTVIATSGGTV